MRYRLGTLRLLEFTTAALIVAILAWWSVESGARNSAAIKRSLDRVRLEAAERIKAAEKRTGEANQ
jgi:hypothetical protein